MANIEKIKDRIGLLEQDQIAIKEVKELMKGELENDEMYQELLDYRKGINEMIQDRKEEVLKNFGDAQDELVKKQQEISELKEILDVELVGFAFREKSQEIRDHEGNIHHIKINARVVKTNQPNLFEGENE